MDWLLVFVKVCNINIIFVINSLGYMDVLLVVMEKLVIKNFVFDGLK